MPAAVLHAFLLACVGVALEVAFTAVLDYPQARDPRLVGHTYLWMFPIYGLIYPALSWLWPRVGAWPLAARGALYLLLLYVVEYASGWLLRATVGRCPWDYGSARWAVSGLIRLDYAPAWLAACLLFERVYRSLTGR